MSNPANMTLEEILALPPAILNQIPALKPPEGLQSNFVDPVDHRYILDAVATVLFCLALLLFASRMYTKIAIVRARTWDDCESPRSLGYLAGVGKCLRSLE